MEAVHHVLGYFRASAESAGIQHRAQGLGPPVESFAAEGRDRYPRLEKVKATSAPSNFRPTRMLAQDTGLSCQALNMSYLGQTLALCPGQHPLNPSLTATAGPGKSSFAGLIRHGGAWKVLPRHQAHRQQARVRVWGLDAPQPGNFRNGGSGTSGK